MKNKLLLVLLVFCFLGFFSCDKKEIQQTQIATQEVIEIEDSAEVVKQKGINWFGKCCCNWSTKSIF